MNLRSRGITWLAALATSVTIGARIAHAQSSEPGPDHTVTLAVNGNAADISPVTRNQPPRRLAPSTSIRI